MQFFMSVCIGKSIDIIFTYFLFTVDANTTKQKIGKTAMRASYRCASGVTVKLNHNVTMVNTKVQFQPFEVQGNKYGTGTFR